ncbi:MAG: type II secretion system protein [Phycisphaerae bacterium]|nr:type II secretion system protein [Phycisphaerae bacterium]
MAGREKRARSRKPTSAGAERSHTRIIHRKSSIANPRGFTLIELLVVISIIALLLAVLMPVISRVRAQAHAAGCQANLRQWGLYYSMYTTENEGKMPSVVDRTRWYAFVPPVLPREFFASDGGGYDLGASDATMREGRRLLLCPATKPQPLDPASTGLACRNGMTRLAWSFRVDAGISGVSGSSYAQNIWFYPSPGFVKEGATYWRSCLMKGASEVPVYSESRAAVALPCHIDEPPSCEDVPWSSWPSSVGLPCYAMNRHAGGINILFMDWSVRKVGIKELWTLNWCEDFDRAGPWTKAGGVQPEDWPEWMRGFKDY